MMRVFCRTLFTAAALPLTTLWMGYALRHREYLPRNGPAIVIANHNSHLDALVLLSLFPLRLVPSIRIAAAADYFFTNPVTRFLSKNVAGLVPVTRKGGRDPLAPLADVLAEGDILFLFPEGTRGSPEVMGDIKPGLWHLARRFPQAPVCPVYLHGLGRSLPKGSWIPVPLFADICVGEPFFASASKRDFPLQVKTVFDALRAQTLANIAEPESGLVSEMDVEDAKNALGAQEKVMTATASARQADERQFATFDGTELFYRHWPASRKSGKAVVMFHRGHEHSGRMEHLVSGLGLEDFDFFAWDARGHGKSPGERGDAPGIEALVRDIDVFIKHISDTHGISPENIVVLAQSVGAVLATAWVHDYAPNIRALILGSPAFKVKLYVPFARQAIAFWANRRGNFFVNSYVKAKFLTHDPHRIASFEADPLITRAISARILTGLYDTAERIVADAAAITVPVQLFISGSDWVVHHGPQHRFYNRLNNPLNERHIMPGFYHDTFGEKDQELIISRIRSFIDAVYAPTPVRSGAQEEQAAPVRPPLLWADRCGPSAAERKILETPLPLFSQKGLYFAAARMVVYTLGRFSNGMKLGLETGFDSGSTLDYVYRNEVGGTNWIGRLLDQAYLASPGWTGIRARKTMLEELLALGARNLREAGLPVRVMDVAAGHGRYVLDTLESLGPDGWDRALLRDFSALNVERGTARIQERGLVDKVSFVKGDAFDAEDLASLTPKPTLAVVSGLYELFPENDLVLTSLKGIAAAVQEGGYLAYTNQPWHPQQEFIARVLTSHRDGIPWVMRCRSQAEMDCLVAEAGFEKIDQRIEPQGIFTVSLARRKAGI